MEATLRRRRPLDEKPAAARVKSDLAVLLIWLAVFGVGLRLLVGWPAALALPDRLPSWSAIQVWVQSPGGSLDALVSFAANLAWLVWFWTLASVLLRVVVDVADALTRGAHWVRSIRWVSDWLTLPVVRRAVDASLAGLLLARVVVQPALASASTLSDRPVPAVIQSRLGGDKAGQSQLLDAMFAWNVAEPERLSMEDVTYTVKDGDTLSAIALEFYGDAEQAERIFQANLGRPEPGGREFNRHGLIIPGWTLLIPSAAQRIESDHDSAQWYVVKEGDTLSGIAGQLLGDERRYPDLFALNVGVANLGADGPVLSDPDLIWPGLRLRLPGDPPAGDGSQTSAEPDPPPSEPSTADKTAQPDLTAPTRSEPPDQERQSDMQPDAAAVVASTPTAATGPAIVSTPTEPASPAQFATPSSAVPVVPNQPPPAPAAAHLSPGLAASAGAGAAAVAMAAGVLVVRRRKPAPIPTGPETDVLVESGFAESDPVEWLARRLAKTSDPPSAVASLMSQAYAAVFAEHLAADEQQQATAGVTLAAARHGRTATTLILSAPIPARPHLIRSMRAAAEHAFGKHVDVDGLVSSDGDVLVRLTWDSRHPVPARVLELVNPESSAAIWPAPCLVRLLVGYDRQPIDVNWQALGNVLVASPTGQGAETPLVALVASLVSVRRPEDLGLVLILRPHTVPDEIGLLPHGLADPVDPTDTGALDQVIAGVRQELDRRIAADATDQPDLVVVIGEICDLAPSAVAQLGMVAAAGPAHGVRLVVASARPVTDLLKACPFLDEFGTRVVLQTRDEEESVALLGAPGAEELGHGGHALMRFEGRVPIQGWACRVPSDHLARLLNLMGTRAPSSARAALDASDVPDLETELADPAASESVTRDRPETGSNTSDAPSLTTAVGNQPSRESAAWTGSPLLQKLRSAPIRVRCFGARDVLHGDQLLQLGEAELLLLLSAHPVSGIQSESLVDMLWATEPSDPERALRVRRHRLRKELRVSIPGLSADPLPGDAAHGERVVSLDPAVVSSDVHEFLELLNCAPKLDSPAAAQAYEAALALYRADLLDAPDVPNFRWMYDGAQIALTLRSDYRRQHRDARLHLAELLASGPEAGLARAEELYSSLCAEDPEDDRLWIALFRVHERAGSALGLESAVRRLRAALAELAPGESDVDTIPLPAKLDSVVRQIRERIGGSPVHTK